jgi:hypothetical protein
MYPNLKSGYVHLILGYWVIESLKNTEKGRYVLS